MNKYPFSKIGFGGGCHWCTEAVFMSLKGVKNVKQGWIASYGENSEWSEAVQLEFNPSIISLKDLIEVHLNTHASTSTHSMRKKYRSAVYFTDDTERDEIIKTISELALNFQKPVITTALKIQKFKLNKESQLNYFINNEENQFCERYIHPKLDMLKTNFENLVSHK